VNRTLGAQASYLNSSCSIVVDGEKINECKRVQKSQRQPIYPCQVNKIPSVQVSYLSVLCSVVVDGAKIGDSKARIGKSKVKINESFQVTTMSILNALGTQASYFNAMCSIIILTI
jgi:hypothetical protein